MQCVLKLSIYDLIKRRKCFPIETQNSQ